MAGISGRCYKGILQDVYEKFSLSNMGEIAVKSHASGKKHHTAVTQSQKASSVSEFFEAKSRTTSGFVLKTLRNHLHH